MTTACDWTELEAALRRERQWAVVQCVAGAVSAVAFLVLLLVW